MMLSVPVRTRSCDPLIDELLDVYLGWREECVAVNNAYERWRTADRPDRALLHAAYDAALEREHCAATYYQRVVEQLAATGALDTEGILEGYA